MDTKSRTSSSSKKKQTSPEPQNKLSENKGVGSAFSTSIQKATRHKLRNHRISKKFNPQEYDKCRQNLLSFLAKLKTLPEEHFPDLEEIQKEYKLEVDELPSNEEIPSIFDAIYRRLTINNTQKRNWYQEDVTLLFWLVTRYSALHHKAYCELTQEDWANMGNIIPEKDSDKCKYKFLSLKKTNSNLLSNPWSSQEEDSLKNLLINKRKEEIKWDRIAKELYSKTGVFRTGKLCRERWKNYLDPELKKTPWSEDEDILLVERVLSCGKKWCEISRMLPGRNEHSVKNRYFSLLRQEKKRLKRQFMAEGKTKRRKKSSYNSNKFSESELLRSLFNLKKEKKPFHEVSSAMEESPLHQEVKKEHNEQIFEPQNNAILSPVLHTNSIENAFTSSHLAGQSQSQNSGSKPNISLPSMANSNINPQMDKILPNSLNQGINNPNSMEQVFNNSMNNIGSSTNLGNPAQGNSYNSMGSSQNQMNMSMNHMTMGHLGPRMTPMNSHHHIHNPNLNQPNNMPFDVRNENNMFLNNFYNFMPNFLPFQMMNNPFSAPFFHSNPNFNESFTNFNQNPFQKLSDSLDKMHLKPPNPNLKKDYNKPHHTSEDLKIISLSHLDGDPDKMLHKLAVSQKEHDLTPKILETLEEHSHSETTPNFFTEKQIDFAPKAETQEDCLNLKVKNLADLTPQEKNSRNLRFALVDLEKNEVFFLNQAINLTNLNSESSARSGSYISMNNSNTSNSLSAKFDIIEAVENLNNNGITHNQTNPEIINMKRSKFVRFVNNE